MLPIIYCQYHVCWCHGDLRSQGISRHDIDQTSQNIPGTLEKTILRWQEWTGPKIYFFETNFGLQRVDNRSVNHHIDGLVQDCSYSIANALELLQSCSKPLISSTHLYGNEVHGFPESRQDRCFSLPVAETVTDDFRQNSHHLKCHEVK